MFEIYGENDFSFETVQPISNTKMEYEIEPTK